MNLLLVADCGWPFASPGCDPACLTAVADHTQAVREAIKKQVLRARCRHSKRLTVSTPRVVLRSANFSFYRLLTLMGGGLFAGRDGARLWGAARVQARQRELQPAACFRRAAERRAGACSVRSGAGVSVLGTLSLSAVGPGHFCAAGAAPGSQEAKIWSRALRGPELLRGAGFARFLGALALRLRDHL